MPHENNELQFELMESLYFKPGSYVEELLNISLDPNVTIQSDEDYITIRGEIVLQGEYQATLEDNEEGLTIESEELTTKRYMEHISTLEENVHTFSHQLPVEISVPMYRVTSIDDIRVEILDFNYEFPTNNHLKLQAVAKIYGLKKADEEQEENREEELEDSFEALDFPSFAFELNNEEPEELEEADDGFDEVREEVEVDVRVEEIEEQEEVELDQDVSYLTDMFRGDNEERYSKMRICIVQEDDTIETIAERFQISTLQLIKQNELDEDFDIHEGQLLYIPKK